MLVKDIMSTELFTVQSDHTVDAVDDLMNWQHIRHVPVIDQNRHLMGLVTHRDLLKASVSTFAKLTKADQSDLFRGMKVSDLMRTEVITITAEDDLRQAAALLMDEKIGCLPVVDGKELVGILTEADFLTLAWEDLTDERQ